jgi:uncharacterized membrane protein YciS (DUF1049 family)
MMMLSKVLPKSWATFMGVAGWFKASSIILVAFATCGVMFLDLTTTTTYAPIPSKTLILFCQLLASPSFDVSSLDVHWMTLWFLLAKYICILKHLHVRTKRILNAFGNVNF